MKKAGSIFGVALFTLAAMLAVWVSLTAEKKLPHYDVVRGDWEQPKTMFAVSQPTLVVLRAENKICSGVRTDECAGPEGMIELPREHEGKQTVVQTPDEGGFSEYGPGHLHSHIARVVGTRWVETGLVYAVCPTPSAEPLYEQQWTNGIVRWHGWKDLHEFLGSTGFFQFRRFEGHAAALAACAKYPGQSIIPGLNLPANLLAIIW